MYGLLDTHVAKLLLRDGEGLVISGASPTLRILRDSDGFYLDFDSGNFVNAGGTAEATLTELSTLGIYTKPFTPSENGVLSPDSYTLVYDYTVVISEVPIDVRAFESVVFDLPKLPGGVI